MNIPKSNFKVKFAPSLLYFISDSYNKYIHHDGNYHDDTRGSESSSSFAYWPGFWMTEDSAQQFLDSLPNEIESGNKEK